MKVSSGTSFPPYLWLICLIGGLCLYGCYLPKHYQKGKPFVFKNNIDLQADLPNAEKKDLGRNLALQLDDSLLPQQRDLLFIWHSILYPAVYDTSYASSSLKTIRYYLAGQGFFSPEVSFSYKIDTVKASKPRKTQYRATTTFHVKAGPRTLLDSIVVSFGDSELQRLADSSKKSSFLKSGEAFNADNLQNEIDRLITIYKNHGYYGITRSAFQIELDTINPTLINPILDPLERIRRFAEESRQQKNPTTDVYLTLSPVLDSSLLKRYYIRRVFIYPDYETTRDNRKNPLTGIILDSVILRYQSLKFKPSFLLRNSFLRPGDLYRQDNNDKTLNTLNFLGVWQVPIVQAREIKDSSITHTTDSAAARAAADSAQEAAVLAAHSRYLADSLAQAQLSTKVDSTLAAMDTAPALRHLDSSGQVTVLRTDSSGQVTTQRADSSAQALAHPASTPWNGPVRNLGPQDTAFKHMDTGLKGMQDRFRDSVGQLDFYYLLTPAKKQSFNSDIELNYNAVNNSSTTGIASGNLIGLDGNLGITNRNVGKEAISMTNTISAGAEANPNYDWNLASVDLGYSNAFTFPRFVTPINSINRKHLLAQQTIISSNATYVERIGYFDLNNFSVKYGFQWKTDTNLTWSFNPIDIEYSRLYNITSAFDTALSENPFLRYAYTNALIMAQNEDLLWTFGNPRHPGHSNVLRANLETSGLLASFLKKQYPGNPLLQQLFEYIRPSLDYKHEIKYRNNNSWDFRVFAGVGIPLGGDSTLPFFKQFVAGGPNSMRAWEFRQLGPGSVHLAPYQDNIFNDRFGDIQLETNLEYRYNIAEIIPNSMYLKGAIFTDIGNIWDFKKQPFSGSAPPSYDSATLDISHLYQELAVGAGVGFRLDFNYFILRFDFGFRFKKPDQPINDGWQWPEINLAHVFGRSENNKEWRYNNYNFSFGIGYSF